MGAEEKEMRCGTAVDLYTGGLYLAKNPDWHVEDSEWKANQISRIIDCNKVVFESCVEVGMRRWTNPQAFIPQIQKSDLPWM
jgi:hypothetical protein